jgi:hypothetical protein
MTNNLSRLFQPERAHIHQTFNQLSNKQTNKQTNKQRNIHTKGQTQRNRCMGSTRKGGQCSHSHAQPAIAYLACHLDPFFFLPFPVSHRPQSIGIVLLIVICSCDVIIMEMRSNSNVCLACVAFLFHRSFVIFGC